MWLDQHSLFGPLARFLKSLPFITAILIAVPFVAPKLSAYLVSPLLPRQHFEDEEKQVNKKSLDQQLANARQEIQNLKELLKAYKTMGPEERSLHRSILAKNLGHSPQLYRRGLVLSPDGAGQVQVGSPVVYQNQLIGLVDEVSKSWCHVQLLADPEFKIAVDIISSKKNEAPAEGWPRGILGGQIAVSNGSEVIVRHIDNSRISDIQVGDYVVTSGFDFKVQKGLLIGKVRDVVEGNLFLHLPVKLQLDPLSKPLYKILPPMPNPFQKASQ